MWVQLGCWLGSVSHQCIHHASCPVAVIPHAWMGSDRHGRVVVGVDGSDESCGALRWAIAAAAQRHADLDVVNAYDYVAVVMPLGMGPGIDRETLEKESRKLLEQIVQPELPCRPPTSCRRGADSGRPASAARALLDTAIGADLLVVGLRAGRSGLRGGRARLGQPAMPPSRPVPSRRRAGITVTSQTHQLVEL